MHAPAAVIHASTATTPAMSTAAVPAAGDATTAIPSTTARTYYGSLGTSPTARARMIVLSANFTEQGSKLDLEVSS